MSRTRQAPATAPDFVREQGPAYLAHVLHRLADELVRGAARWYPEAGVLAPPRTTSTLLLLDERGPLATTEIAAALRQSHPLVITWRNALANLEFVEAWKDASDARRTIVGLTRLGREEVLRVRAALRTVEEASRALLSDNRSTPYESLWHMDRELQRMSFYDRLKFASDDRR